MCGSCIAIRKGRKYSNVIHLPTYWRTSFTERLPSTVNHSIGVTTLPPELPANMAWHSPRRFEVAMSIYAGAPQPVIYAAGTAAVTPASCDADYIEKIY